MILRFIFALSVAFLLVMAGGAQAVTNVVPKVKRVLPTVAPISATVQQVHGIGAVTSLAEVDGAVPLGQVARDANVIEVAGLGQVAKDTYVVVVAGLDSQAKGTNVAVVAGICSASSGTGVAAVAGLGGAARNTNVAAVAGMSPAGRVLVDFIREINQAYGVGDDVAFLADVEVWRSGPLGQIITRAIRAKRDGDMATYSNCLARYWAEYRVVVERRRLFGKEVTRRSVVGR